MTFRKCREFISSREKFHSILKWHQTIHNLLSFLFSPGVCCQYWLQKQNTNCKTTVFWANWFSRFWRSPFILIFRYDNLRLHPVSGWKYPWCSCGFQGNRNLLIGLHSSLLRKHHLQYLDISPLLLAHSPPRGCHSDFLIPS